jgi:D-glycero-D-manno-heptose 1,7-bisphosphate phosphatase
MKAVFLDRDGTVIPDPPDERVDTIEEVQLFPDSIEALKLLADNGFNAIFITNQAGIAEGLLNEQDFERLNNAVLERLKPSGLKFLKTFMCPHSPNDNCECRKPSPKMILDAAKEFGVDLSNSYMIGDRPSDIMAGVNAGTKTILVKTANVPVSSEEATYTAPNLLDAAKYVVNN